MRSCFKNFAKNLWAGNFAPIKHPSSPYKLTTMTLSLLTNLRCILKMPLAKDNSFFRNPPIYPQTIVLMASLILLGCGSQDGAGGSASETEASLAGVLRNTSGQYITGAPIQLRERQSLDSLPLEIEFTDSIGRFTFAEIPPGTYSITATQNDLSAWTVSHADSNEQTVELQLDSSVNANFTLLKAGAPVQGEVVVYGLGRSSVLDAQGRVEFRYLPKAGHWLALRQNGRVEAEFPWTPGQQFIELPPTQALLVDNFESAVLGSPLGHWWGNTEWWTLQKDPQDPSTTILPSVIDEDRTQILADGVDGRSLHLYFAVRTPSWALISLPLATSGLGLDIRGLDSISVYAQGQGVIHLHLVSPGLPTFGDFASHLSISLPLPTVWDRLVIPRSTIQSVSNERGINWDDFARSVGGVQFVARDTVDLWLDNIYLHGSLLGN